MRLTELAQKPGFSLPAGAFGKPGFFLARAWVLLTLAALACAAPFAPTPALPPTQQPPTAPPPTPTLLPTAAPTTRPVTEHRIGVRVIDGVGEFYDRVTGEKFVPRGNNYNKLRSVDDSLYGDQPLDVTLANGYYDREEVRRDFERMRAWGYNIVRVMPETCSATGCISSDSVKIRPEYIANMVDFLTLAKEYGIYVWIASNTLPDVGYYLNKTYAYADDTWDGGNLHFLHPGGIALYQEYFHDLVSALIAADAPLDAVFSYELRQEQNYDANYPPLSLDSGLVTPANGQTYDMSVPGDKKRMMEDGLVDWVDSLRETILALDPTALVSIGFYPPNEPHAWIPPDDPRIVHSEAVIWRSQADFVDLHLSPWNSGLTMQELVDNFGMEGMAEKPIVMGELSAFVPAGFSSPAAAARALHDWQVESCTYGFDGWLVWSWDAFVQTDIWHTLSGDGEIGQALAPSARPDPCAPGSFEFFETNLALGRPVRASQALPDQPAENAVDGAQAQWGAGADAPQWIEIDLGEPSAIRLIRLVVAQYPEGETVHQVLGRGAGGDFSLLHEFRGLTSEPQVLEFRPDTPLEGIQVIRILTTESPSWVSWHEIEIIAR